MFKKELLYMYGHFPIAYYSPVRQELYGPLTSSGADLNRRLRALWEQHIYWTRLTVNSIVDELPDVKQTTARLLRNPDDFAAVLMPLYGQAIAAEFARLLREHLTIAAELVTDLKKGDTPAARDAQKRWYANADNLAVFLSRINPYWSKAEWQRMLYEHLQLLTEEVAARIGKDYDKNVALNDRIEPQALEMADVMTNGIIRQFPAHFLH